MKNRALPTLEELRSFLRYEPETGLFYWIGRRPKVKVGSVAGGEYNGYIGIRFLDRVIYAHRLAYLFTYDKWPEGDVDHKDGDKKNNRIDNLRACTRSQNNGNRRRDQRNKSGLKGVSWNRICNRWSAFIGRDGITIYLGLFDTSAAAHAAYVAAAKELFGEFARAA